MKNTILLSIILLTFSFFVGKDVKADWWSRPTERPTPPVIDREPTNTPMPNPTTVVPTSSVSPTWMIVSPTGISNITPPIGGNGDSSDDSGEDACASGKSYTGPYCGWSPDHDSKSNDSVAYIYDPNEGIKIKGLSKTAGNDLLNSDIILFAGVLCVLLYLKSKLETEKQP